MRGRGRLAEGVASLTRWTESVFYNLRRYMRGRRNGRRLALGMRPLVAIGLPLCVIAALAAKPQGQPAGNSAGAGWTLIGHGQLAEAEALAKGRPANDADAAAILGHLAIRRGRYQEATAILQPAADRHPASEAALQ